MKKLILLLALLPSFAFAVPSDNTVNYLRFDAPTEFEDGTIIQLGDIGGYWVYYKTDAQIFNDAKRINLTSGTEISLSSIPALSGKVYLSVTSYDQAGNESGFSTEITAALSADGQWTISRILPPTGLRLGK